MKNDLMRYVLKKSTIVQSFIAVCIAAVVSLGVIIFSAVFLDPPAREKALNNITTVPLAFWMFISAVTVSSECANMSICLNRSRRSALKTVFASLLISTVVFAAVNFAAEALLSGVCPGLGLNYSFSPNLWHSKDRHRYRRSGTRICIPASRLLLHRHRRRTLYDRVLKVRQMGLGNILVSVYVTVHVRTDHRKRLEKRSKQYVLKHGRIRTVPAGSNISRLYDRPDHPRKEAGAEQKRFDVRL